MAHHHTDNVHTTTFTPREPSLELLDTALSRNTIISLCNKSSNNFIIIKLIQETATTSRGKTTLYITDNHAIVAKKAACIKRLTDLSVGQFVAFDSSWTRTRWKKLLQEKHVLVLATNVATQLLSQGHILWSDLNLVILHGGVTISKQNGIDHVFSSYESSRGQPLILTVTSSIMDCLSQAGLLEEHLVKLEDLYRSKVETASDILSVLRYSVTPKERFLECAPHQQCSLDLEIEREIKKALEFLENHCYDPLEMYEEEFLEELQQQPDPKKEPLQLLYDFLEILYSLGPWCADRAAYVYILHVEKLKVKTPYERHFLLLCMVSTVFVKIRAICDDFFKDMSEKEKIYNYSSSKVLRLIEIIRNFKPVQSTKSVISNSSKCKCQLIHEYLAQRLVNPSLFPSFDHFMANELNVLFKERRLVLELNKSSVINFNRFKCDKNFIANCISFILSNQKSGILNKLVKLNGNKFSLNLDEFLRKSEKESLLNDYVTQPRYKVPRHVRPKNQQQTISLGENEIKIIKSSNELDPTNLCGLIFVEKRFTAKVIFQLLSELRQADEDFSFLNVQFTVEKLADPLTDSKEAEAEHRKQELVLKKFRMRDCNLLVGTSFLEEGIDLPKCNLVVRFDPPTTYRSYVNSKGRARAVEPLVAFLVESGKKTDFIRNHATYCQIEKMLLKKCEYQMPDESEELEADKYTALIEPLKPLPDANAPAVNLAQAVSLVNRYCAKLPSDTFTRLTPLWKMKSVKMFGREMFICHLRLPINSPVKYEIIGCPMPTKVLAKRFAAFECCHILHSTRELDNYLQPISKETFWMREEEQLTSSPEDLEDDVSDNVDPRPGTTKRRQYYYKRIAESLTDCRPTTELDSYLYEISMELSCPLPEEQNTRGRKIYPPEDSVQGFGILTLKKIPKIGPFPIFTRCGEVEVKLCMTSSRVRLTSDQIIKIVAFIHYTFTSVLRLQKHLMMFDPASSENSYFVVPTKKDSKSCEVVVDWEFLNMIYSKKDEKPDLLPDEQRTTFTFDVNKYEDAVVLPWYRNQDQPQYFYVAEICHFLSPMSKFPGTEYDTFEDYYYKKYEIKIQNTNQPLLDVDHTSARLNFLTPRYVNRKGVALPTTSEEKKKAKRENLEQKQILVPELCNVHPFSASLWRKAVCLPCILHRVNALLLADEVRQMVCQDIAIGIKELEHSFDWSPLDFGWSLADVLYNTKTEETVVEKKMIKEKEEENLDNNKEVENVCAVNEKEKLEKNDSEQLSGEDDIEEAGKAGEDWMEIGTWNNDMMKKISFSMDGSDDFNMNMDLPNNLTFVDGMVGEQLWKSGGEKIRYGSPTNWVNGSRLGDQNSDYFCSDDSFSDQEMFGESDDSSESGSGGLKIEFTEDNTAEAVEDQEKLSSRLKDFLEENEETDEWNCLNEADNTNNKYVTTFQEAVSQTVKNFESEQSFVPYNVPFTYSRCLNKTEFRNFNFNPDLTTPQVDVFHPDKTAHVNISINEHFTEDLPHINIIKESITAHAPIYIPPVYDDGRTMIHMQFKDGEFSFDSQPDLDGHPGPSPSLILQALTMSNANDGINLERLETIGDSFLKYAITTYLYCTYENIHEGKLSHLRSKQVSNLNLYRLGRRKMFGESMVATKFEPHDNWLPPCYYVPKELERALIEVGFPASYWNRADLPSLHNLNREEICQLVRERGEKLGFTNTDNNIIIATPPNFENMPCFIPYNLMTQHSIPDKSLADCVEALIGAYLIACGPRGALLFMSWLGIKVLPKEIIKAKTKEEIMKNRVVGSTEAVWTKEDDGSETWTQIRYGELKPPKSPLIRLVSDPDGELERMLTGFDAFEESLNYHFRDRSYLLQALTHASYSPNRLTDCYQRLEFLGDAVLDYLITRHLYENSKQHSPGALTDLRSALVNNTIFASLAVRHSFHKYFRHLSPGLNEVVDRFVRIQEENNHSIVEECYLIGEEECEEAEDVEVPKALGDVFESIAGAVFLDSGMSLDAVWKVYYAIMKNEIELFSANVPKSPIRELFELEPETAKFGKPEKLADGRRVRVTVEVFGKGIFKGIGRNYRIAKCTAAKCALKQLKRKGLLEKKRK